MLNSAFSAMVGSLNTAGLSQPKQDKISAEAYNEWRHCYLFDALKNQRYGQSFCNTFDVTDNILFYERDITWADTYIKRTYVRNDAH